ncbi:MAG: sucrase ferredoxin [Cyanobacteriota bacterium]|nr:sucrase ferredoxin [Cyanobacteriota bacterium]
MNQFFCANLSRESGEDIIGSAPSHQIYIAIECQQPWAPSAFDSKFVPPNLRALVEEVRRMKRSVRFLLISTKDSQPKDYTRVLAFHKRPEPSGGYTRREFRVMDIAEVAPIVERYLINPDFVTVASFPVDPAVQDFLICTHGSHDKCCAHYGKPFYHQALKLASELGWSKVRFWQASHIGGHRFAPTMISLPDGRYYGGLDGESMRAIAEKSGKIHHYQKVYRGWGILPRKAQVLERQLLLQYGWDWLNYQVECEMLHEDSESATVRLHCHKPGIDPLVWEADIVEDETKTLHMQGSCGSHKESRFPKYRVACLQLKSAVGALSLANSG